MRPPLLQSMFQAKPKDAAYIRKDSQHYSSKRPFFGYCPPKCVPDVFRPNVVKLFRENLFSVTHRCDSSLQGVIEARMESFKSAHAFGISLVEQDHFAAEEIRENCEELTLVKDELMESWDEKQIELSQSYELQVS